MLYFPYFLQVQSYRGYQIPHNEGIRQALFDRMAPNYVPREREPVSPTMYGELSANASAPIIRKMHALLIDHRIGLVFYWCPLSLFRHGLRYMVQHVFFS